MVGESDMRGAGVKPSSGIRFGSMNMEGSALSPAVMVARGMEPASVNVVPRFERQVIGGGEALGVDGSTSGGGILSLGERHEGGVPRFGRHEGGVPRVGRYNRSVTPHEV